MPDGRSVFGRRSARAEPNGRRRSAVRFDRVDTLRRSRGITARLADPTFRLFYAIGFRSARCLWRLTHPRHRGALVAVLVGRSMLVLRQSYRLELAMPGGGVDRGEAPIAAACRELAEELNLVVRADQLREVHTDSGVWDGRRDTVTFFEIELERLPVLRLDNREVVEAGLVPLDGIGADDVTPAVGAYLAWRRDGRSAFIEPRTLLPQ